MPPGVGEKEISETGSSRKLPVFICGALAYAGFMSERIRLDKYLLEYGFMDSRSEAQAAIKAGNVRINGKVVSKASVKVEATDKISAEKAHPYVSRAALKLKGGLDVFPVSVKDRTCLDIGCSTGGFTEVLLEAEAKHVISVDVGRDQFHARLRSEPRVSLFEQLDARNICADHLSQAPELIVSDASFIGLEKVLQPSLDFAADGADLIALFKPQFQVGPKAVGKGGIVTDLKEVEAAKSVFVIWLREQGWQIKAWQPSSITGSDGNQEWLVWATKGRR